MTDKFILMGLNDKKSKKVAEVLGNETCKKIIDHLAEIKEASEKDIADALNIKLNTLEYNLKKLLDSGLVAKTKNFFWSKKGKKISMYKLAKKHIIISPRSKKPNPKVLRTILPVVFTAALLLTLIMLSIPSQEMNKFNSIEELNSFIEKNRVEPTRPIGIFDVIEEIFSGGIRPATTFQSGSGAGTTGTITSEKAQFYSETNVQVKGVDEADIVKNDGKYIYVASGNKVTITDAYPAEDMEILSEIDFGDEAIYGIFINGEDLIVFSGGYGEVLYKGEIRCMAIGCVVPPQEAQTNVYIYDISNKENPELEDTFSVSGGYHSSRMIGKYVYLVNNQFLGQEKVLPTITENSKIDVIEANEIYYSDIEDVSFQYTIVLAINIKTGEASEKVLLTGRAQNIFVSEENIYTTYNKYRKDKTVINKFSINKNKIEYLETGEVPGYVLNQFSMDEYKGNFRIATTIGRSSSNNVYVLDEDLKIIGRIEDLAEGEKIYSARFLGEKAYLVTFRQVDPFFVIDLSIPENPKVLGELKIPGYSDYLHPYDKDHIIGIGKDATETGLFQGVKMALFDVTDVENPIELYKVIIGERGTESEALHDHKAFLFDREKELLVLPIQNEKTYDETFNGAHVYNINLEEGFNLKGRINHTSSIIQRSLYMDDTLYTISNKMIKANDLDNLNEINYVEF